MFLLLIWIPLHLKLNSIQWHPFCHAHHQYLHQKRVFALQYTVTRLYFQLPNFFNSLLFTVLFHLWTIETFSQFLALTIDIWIKRKFRTSTSQRYFTIVWTLFDFLSLLTWVTCLKLLPLILNYFKLFRKIQSCRKSLHGSQSSCVKTKLDPFQLLSRMLKLELIFLKYSRNDWFWTKYLLPAAVLVLTFAETDRSPELHTRLKKIIYWMGCSSIKQRRVWDEPFLLFGSPAIIQASHQLLLGEF